MSTTTTGKRTWRQAMEDATAFRDLFQGCWERWEIAGSVRRLRDEVGDVEHVVIPKFGRTSGGDLFGQTEPVNLLWRMLEEYERQRVLTKHIYGMQQNGAPLYRFGEKYRGVDFRGFNHEIFTATPTNWGAILLIRTGPADFSQRVVTAFRDGGMYRQMEGDLIHVASSDPVAVPDEDTYLKLAGLPFVAPERRL